MMALPRKQRDRHILFRAIAQTVEGKSPYSEQDLNRSLREWVASTGLDSSLDHVSLRRYLVEYGYLIRDRAGRLYTVRIHGNETVRFDSGIQALDVVDFVWSCKTRATARRRRWLGQ